LSNLQVLLLLLSLLWLLTCAVLPYIVRRAVHYGIGYGIRLACKMEERGHTREQILRALNHMEGKHTEGKKDSAG
jgi:hypothetical protein